MGDYFDVIWCIVEPETQFLAFGPTIFIPLWYSVCLSYCLTRLNASPLLKFHWSQPLPLACSLIQLCAGVGVGEHMEDPAFRGLETTAAAGLLVGSSILFVKVNPLPTEAAPGRGAMQPKMSENMECPRPSPRLAFQAARQPLPRECHCRV